MLSKKKSNRDISIYTFICSDPQEMNSAFGFQQLHRVNISQKYEYLDLL